MLCSACGSDVRFWSCLDPVSQRFNIMCGGTGEAFCGQSAAGQRKVIGGLVSCKDSRLARAGGLRGRVRGPIARRSPTTRSAKTTVWFRHGSRPAPTRLAPLFAAASGWVDHFLVAEVARFHGPAQRLESPRRNCQLFHVARDNSAALPPAYRPQSDTRPRARAEHREASGGEDIRCGGA